MFTSIIKILQPVIMRAVLKALEDPVVMQTIEDELVKAIAAGFTPTA